MFGFSLDERFMKAVKKGDLAKVKRFLDKSNKELPDITKGYGENPPTTPLYEALQRKHIDVATELMRYPAVRWTTFLVAAKLGNIRMVQLFIDNGENVNDSSINGHTVLHSAVEGNQFKMVKFLVEKHKANVFAIEEEHTYNGKKYGVTPVQLAHAKGYMDIFDYLKSVGVKVYQAERAAKEAEEAAKKAAEEAARKPQRIIMTPQRLAEAMKCDKEFTQQLIQDNEFEDMFDMLSYEQALDVYKKIQKRVDVPIKKVMENIIRNKRQHTKG